jgi:hypothetical protein
MFDLLSVSLAVALCLNSIRVYLIHAMRIFEMTIVFVGTVSTIALIHALMTEVAI